MISIVIPTLNEEEYIENVLLDLKVQLEDGDEIIVVDAKSTDRTKEIAKKNGAKILDQPRNGNGIARTEGAKISKNEYVIFIDADSKIQKNYLGIIKKHLQERPLVVGGLDLYTSDSNFWKLIYNSYSKIIFLIAKINHKITKECYVPSNNCAFHKDTFLSVGGYRSVVCEDADLMRRFPKTKNIIYNDKMIIELSDRRFKKNGFFRTVAFWTWSNIKLIIGGTVDSTDYKKGY